MSSRPLLQVRLPGVPSLVLALLVAAAASGPTAAWSASVGVRLLSSSVPLVEADAEFQVIARDRRSAEEGGHDPSLLGRLARADGPVEVRADGPGPAFAIPSLVLRALREAGFSASAEASSGAMSLEVTLHRFWLGGVERPTVGIDLVLSLRSPASGRVVRRQRIEVWGSSPASPPEGLHAAVGQALAELRRELRELFGSGAFEATVLVDGVEEAEIVLPANARRPGYAMRRRIGFGGATRAGVETIPDRGIAEPQVEFLTLELRLVAADFFSFDWLIDVIGPLATAAGEGGRYPLEFKTTLLAHFAVAASSRAAIAVAPGLHIHAIPYDFSDPSDSDAIVYFAFRLGVDLSPPGRDFGFGIYLRPMIGGAVDYPEDGTRFEVYAEIAWTLFAGPWERVRRR